MRVNKQGRLLRQTLAIFALLIASVPAAFAQDDQDAQGQNAFMSNCASCHGSTGEGISGVFPPLAGHVEVIAELEGGADYLLEVMVFGVEGPILVNGEKYNGVMPAWAHLGDSTLAAIANYVLSEWGDSAIDVIVEADVEAIRVADKSAKEVYFHRTEIGLEMPDDDGGPVEMTGFTASQAATGQSLYRNNCASCHGDDLRGNIDGPELVGDYFLAYWGERSVAELYGYAKGNMPPGRAGTLEDQQYLDIVTWILSNNGHIAEGSQPWRPDDAVLQQIKNNNTEH